MAYVRKSNGEKYAEKFADVVAHAVSLNPTDGISFLLASFSYKIVESMIRSSLACAPLRDFILENSKHIGEGHKFSERMYAAVNGMSSFPKCVHCGKELSDQKNFIRFSKGYRDFCSVSCMENDENVMRKKAETSMRNCGYAHWTKSAELMFRRIERNLEKYGKEWYTQTDDFKAKSAKTLKGNYGVERPLQNQEVRSKFKATVAAFTDKQKTDRRQAQRDAFIRNYGVTHPMKDPSFRRRLLDEMKDRYGAEFPFQVPEFLTAAQCTCEKNYGVKHPLQNPGIMAKLKSSYEYDGRYFDSAPELALYVWLADSGRDFKYHEHSGIAYSFAGAEYTYFPDFELFDNGVVRLLEVKGAHFFRPDGAMFCPFRKKGSTDEEYAEINAKYEAKRQCMLANGVEILTYPGDELDACMKFCAKKFDSAEWYRRFRNKKEEV